MSNIVFVPISDELLFDHPELIRGPLIPYVPGMRVGTAGSVNIPVANHDPTMTRKLAGSPMGNSGG